MQPDLQSDGLQSDELQPDGCRSDRLQSDGLQSDGLWPGLGFPAENHGTWKIIKRFVSLWRRGTTEMDDILKELKQHREYRNSTTTVEICRGFGELCRVWIFFQAGSSLGTVCWLCFAVQCEDTDSDGLISQFYMLCSFCCHIAPGGLGTIW